MKIKICPMCGGKKFLVTAHVTQTWVVDECGEFDYCDNECEEVLHEPDDEDIWCCAECMYSGAGSEFNVEVEE